MGRHKRWALGSLLVVAAVGVIAPAVVAAGPDESAGVRFGNPDAGSPYQPPVFFHDSSSNATDNLIPRTVAISAGGNVTFTVAGFHQVAIYRAGTQPEDITVPAFPGPPQNLFINDPTNRLALQAAPGVQGPYTPPAGTFATPGRYLILCNITPHFAVDKMYGWVIVK
jgi:plastocyanin